MGPTLAYAVVSELGLAGTYTAVVVGGVLAVLALALRQRPAAAP